MNNSFLGLLDQGGWLIYALLTCSVIALAATLERFISLRESKIIRFSLLMEIEKAIKANDLSLALQITQTAVSPMMRIAAVGLLNYKNSKEEIKNAIEDAGKLEIPAMQRFLTLFNTIAVISPLLGLLGTVMGMIDVFGAMLKDGTTDLTNLSVGISEALVTTAVGLSVAVPTLIAYNFFFRRIETLTNQMERHSLTLLNLILRSKNQL